MRKEQYTTPIARSNTNTDFAVKKESLVNQFVHWFRNFLESAE